MVAGEVIPSFQLTLGHFHEINGLFWKAFWGAWESLSKKEISAFPRYEEAKPKKVWSGDPWFYPAVVAEIRNPANKRIRESLIKRMGIDMTYWREQATHHRQESVRQSFLVFHLAVTLSMHVCNDPFCISVIYSAVLFSQKTKAFIGCKELPPFFFKDDDYISRYKNMQSAHSRSKQKNGAITSRKKTGK